MGRTDVLRRARVGWWAGGEPGDPLAALTGYLLRAELRARCPGFNPVLVLGTMSSWAEPGFSGEPVALRLSVEATEPMGSLAVLVASGCPDPGGAKIAHSLSEMGTPTVAIAADESWGLEPQGSVGPPFAFPEPAVLAARHFAPALLAARGAYLRVVEGLPADYVLVEGGLLSGEDGAGDDGRVDLALAGALGRLAERAGSERPAEVVRLAPGPIGAEDNGTAPVLRHRRAESEEARHQPEDWSGDPDRPLFDLRVTSAVDLVAAVAGARAVVARSGPLMALAWALGAPHVAIAAETGAAANFAAWTGDASALAADGAGAVSTIDSIFARRGRPRGLKRLEATLDQSLDEAAANLVDKAREAGPGEGTAMSPAALEARAQELEVVNEALRQRLATERLRFGERAALLEKAANTSVESAIKAVHGQDVIVRRKLQETEREMRRLQEETALQQAELREIHASWTMRAAAPARAWFGRLRGSSS
jgi:hypothetical protein